MVVTDSFHGTVLSIILQVPFWSLLRDDAAKKDNMNSRLTSILRLSGLESRFIPDRSAFPADLSILLDFDFAESYLSPLRSRSIEYLTEILSQISLLRIAKGEFYAFFPAVSTLYRLRRLCFPMSGQCPEPGTGR